MKPELTEKILEWIQQTCEKIGDFASQQIPPFIQEYLQWKFLEAGFGVGQYVFSNIIMVVIAFIATKSAIKFYKKSNGATEEPATTLTMSAIMVIGLFLNGILGFPSQEIKDMIQIKTAPKVYMVEKATELLKQEKK